jgi:hypothetical protein
MKLSSYIDELGGSRGFPIPKPLTKIWYLEIAFDISDSLKDVTEIILNMREEKVSLASKTVEEIKLGLDEAIKVISWIRDRIIPMEGLKK